MIDTMTGVLIGTMVAITEARHRLDVALTTVAEILTGLHQTHTTVEAGVTVPVDITIGLQVEVDPAKRLCLKDWLSM